MTLPTDLRPRCTLATLDFWVVIAQVAAALNVHGYPSQAREFRTRALTLNQDASDSTDLLALVTEYVEVG